MGLAGQDKRSPDEMNRVGAADGRSPVTLRGETVTLSSIDLTITSVNKKLLQNNHF